MTYAMHTPTDGRTQLGAGRSLSTGAMIRRSWWHCLVAASVVGCGPSTDLTSEHTAAIRDSVATVMADFRRYSAEAEWDSLLSLYTEGPEFHWVEDGAVQYSSTDEIRAAIEAAGSGVRLVTTHREMKVTPLAPGVASVFTLFDTQLIDSAGPGFSYSGAVTMVVVHRESGWRILSGHSSTPGGR
jgi:hypothetical protein